MPAALRLPARRLPARRLGVALAVLVLPVTAACGSSTSEAPRQSPQTTLQQAADHLGDSKAFSAVLHLTDGTGNVKKALTSGTDPMTADEADLLLGGSVSVVIDPVGDTTLRDAQAAAASGQQQLDASNAALTVSVDGSDLFQARLVAGDLYAKIDLDKIAELSGQDLGQLEQQAPPDVAPLLRDVQAGKWVKLPLQQISDQLSQLGGGAATTPSVSPQLGASLLDAVKPFVAISEASADGDGRTLDVKIQAKQALKAALDTFKAMGPAVPGLSTLDLSGLDKIGDGTLNGTIALADEHVRTLTLDLASAVALVPPGSTPAPDLSGGTLTADLDDNADEVQVPDDVSSVDVGALVTGLIGQLSALGTAAQPS